MKTRSKTVIKIAILCLSMQECGMSAVAPALGSIMNGMPDVSPTLIQSIATVPTIMLAFCPPIYAKLTELAPKRTLMILSAILFVIGGLGPAFFHSSIYIILFFRLLLGIANGFILPMAADFVIDFFEGSARNTMIGWTTAMTGVSGILFQTLGGYLAGIQWQYCFLAYAVSVFFLAVAIVLMPEPVKEQSGVTDAKPKSRISSGTFLYSCLIAFYFLFTYILITDASIVLLSEGIAVPSQIGLALSFQSIGALAASFFFGPLFKKLGHALNPIASALGALGLFITWQTTSLSIYCVGILFVGLGMGTAVPTTLTKTTCLVPHSAGSMAIGVTYLGVGFGGFINPFIFGLMGPPGRPQFLVGVFGFLVLGLIFLLANRLIKEPAHAAASAISYEKM